VRESFSINGPADLIPPRASSTAKRPRRAPCRDSLGGGGPRPKRTSTLINAPHDELERFCPWAPCPEWAPARSTPGLYDETAMVEACGSKFDLQPAPRRADCGRKPWRFFCPRPSFHDPAGHTAPTERPLRRGSASKAPGATDLYGRAPPPTVPPLFGSDHKRPGMQTDRRAHPWAPISPPDRGR